MKTKKRRQKPILSRAAVIAIMTALLLLTMLSTQASAASDTTVYVSTSAELKSALANTSVEEIIFSNDIAATEAMKIAAKRTSTQLTIDGNGFQFTERYVSTYNTTYGIHLIDATNIDTITVQNMKIKGQNGYGTIYTSKGINQVFKNVEYNGPQMIYNDYGSVRLEDCKIDIGKYNNSYISEVAEVNTVTLAGNVDITKQPGDTDEIFWLKSTGAGITVEDGAVINVTNNCNTVKSGFVYASAGYYFNIGNDVVFNYNGSYFFEETCALKSFNLGTNSKFNVKLGNNLCLYVIKASETVNIGADAEVNLTVDGNLSTYALYATKDMTFGDGSKINIKVNGTVSGTLMYSGASMNFGKDVTVKINTRNVTAGNFMYAVGNMTYDSNCVVDIAIDGNLGCYIMRAGKEMSFGDECDVTVFIEGSTTGHIMYAGTDMIFGKECNVNLNTGKVVSGNFMYAAGNMVLNESCTVNIYTDGNLGCYIMHAGKEMTVGDNARINIVVSGTVTGNLMYACSNMRFGKNSTVIIETGNLSSGNIMYTPGNMIFDSDCLVKIIVNGDIGCTVMHAGKEMTYGTNCKVNIVVDGSVCGYIMYACYNLTFGAGSDINIEIGNITCGCVMISYYKDIIVNENTKVNIKTGSVSGAHVVKALDGSVTINKNAEFVVNSFGAMKTELMWIKRNLTVEENAVLDLIANQNTNTACCSYAISVDGCCEGTLRSVITYNNPKRVLFYNDNISGKSYNYAAYLGHYTSINLNVYATEYWNLAKTAGGPDVLENPDYQWCQDGSYNVTGVSTSNCYGFNKSFSTTYAGAMDKDEYYFGKSLCLKNYEVCLWNGGEKTGEATLTYVFNNVSHVKYAGPDYDKNTYTYPSATDVIISGLIDEFSEYYNYGETCEFLGWSTNPDGDVEYSAGETLTLIADTTLYAVWKSCKPVVFDIYEFDDSVTGAGVYGKGDAGSLITIKFPGGKVVTTLVLSNGSWHMVIPMESLPYMTADSALEVYQTEVGKIPSDTVVVIIQE